MTYRIGSSKRIVIPVVVRDVLAILILLLVGCSEVRLISSYDQEIDKTATVLQKKMDAFLTKLDSKAGTNEAKYDQNEVFYDDYLVELRSLLIRAQSQPENSITEFQIGLMINSLNQLRILHEAGPISSNTVSTTRNLFAQAWLAIITLEQAKKRGNG